MPLTPIGRWRWTWVQQALQALSTRRRSGRWLASRGEASTTAGHGPAAAAPSPLAYVLYARGPEPATEPAQNEFGFPGQPAMAGLDPSGAVFDTTAGVISDDHETIHYQLQFGGLTQPYDMVHEGAGTYTSQDVEMTFTWSDEEQIQQLDAYLKRGQPYRVVVNDVLQLDAVGGRFDWSVTRADVTHRADGSPAVSLLYLVWRIGRPDGDPPRCDRGHPGVAVTDPDGPVAPSFPRDLTPSVDGRTITETTESLLAGDTAF